MPPGVHVDEAGWARARSGRAMGRPRRNFRGLPGIPPAWTGWRAMDPFQPPAAGRCTDAGAGSGGLATVASAPSGRELT
jgi:hypothetical protein